MQMVALMGKSLHYARYGQGSMGTQVDVLSAILGVIWMVLGLVLDIVTLPFRIVFALLSGAEWEFRRFGRRRGGTRPAV